MNDELFTELVASVKEGGAFLRGEKEAARTTRHAAGDHGSQTPRGGVGCGETRSLKQAGKSYRRVRSGCDRTRFKKY